MIHLNRTDSDNTDFQSLVRLLDADLAIRDGDDHAFYAQYNKTNTLKQVLVLYEDTNAIACGAIRPLDEKKMEVKRMFVLPEFRNKGLASMVLSALENWAKELGYQNCVLETGKKQPEAIALYEKAGYRRIPNYGQYAGIENSVCFEKKLS
jgi:GNAT superfamily N-acetyltransferase